MIINRILQRLALGVLTLFVVSLVIFTSVEMNCRQCRSLSIGQRYSLTEVISLGMSA